MELRATIDRAVDAAIAAFVDRRSVARIQEKDDELAGKLTRRMPVKPLATIVTDPFRNLSLCESGSYLYLI